LVGANANKCAVANCKLLEKVRHNMEILDNMEAEIRELKQSIVEFLLIGNASSKECNSIIDAIVNEGA
jgi:hypothetical protein